ncbi:hypothetical protein C8J57DRAFT_550508 [Mycena rebaudengoi]|nr:hypothetical protein C8J57DRAFT_550508 [Mycena rebaudengoi]
MPPGLGTPRVSSVAAPVSVPVQAGAVVETLSGRTARGLHTPASSDDFRGKNLGGADEVHKFEALIRSNAGSARIEPLQLKMSQEIADELEERFSEERDFKLEYLRETGMMIVTYPTALHESFSTLLSAFSYTSHTRDSFVFDTGAELLVTEKDGLRSRVPV